MIDQDMHITLTMDDEEIECIVLNTFEVSDQTYVSLLPLDADDEDEDETEVYLFRLSTTASGEPDLQPIEDETEYELVEDAFDEWLDAQEFEEFEFDDEDE